MNAAAISALHKNAIAVSLSATQPKDITLLIAKKRARLNRALCVIDQLRI